MGALFEGLDRDRVDDIAERYLRVFMAVVAFGRSIDDSDHILQGAGLTKALISTMAEFIVDPQCDEAQQAELFDEIVAELRRDVLKLQARS